MFSSCKIVHFQFCRRCQWDRLEFFFPTMKFYKRIFFPPNQLWFLKMTSRTTGSANFLPNCPTNREKLELLTQRPGNRGFECFSIARRWHEIRRLWNFDAYCWCHGIQHRMDVRAFNIARMPRHSTPHLYDGATAFNTKETLLLEIAAMTPCSAATAFSRTVTCTQFIGLRPERRGVKSILFCSHSVPLKRDSPEII